MDGIDEKFMANGESPMLKVVADPTMVTNPVPDIDGRNAEENEKQSPNKQNNGQLDEQKNATEYSTKSETTEYNEHLVIEEQERDANFSRFSLSEQLQQCLKLIAQKDREIADRDAKIAELLNESSDSTEDGDPSAGGDSSKTENELSTTESSNKNATAVYLTESIKSIKKDDQFSNDSSSQSDQKICQSEPSTLCHSTKLDTTPNIDQIISMIDNNLSYITDHLLPSGREWAREGPEKDELIKTKLELAQTTMMLEELRMNTRANLVGLVKQIKDLQKENQDLRQSNEDLVRSKKISRLKKWKNRINPLTDAKPAETTFSKAETTAIKMETSKGKSPEIPESRTSTPLCVPTETSGNRSGASIQGAGHDSTNRDKPPSAYPPIESLTLSKGDTKCTSFSDFKVVSENPKTSKTSIVGSGRNPSTEPITMLGIPTNLDSVPKEIGHLRFDELHSDSLPLSASHRTKDHDGYDTFPVSTEDSSQEIERKKKKKGLISGVKTGVRKLWKENVYG